jgi:methionine sulfoxide reductase heme-binding subunit
VTTWIILRAAGIGAYVMLFLSVSFGLIATSTPFGKRFAKASAVSVHRFMSTVALLLLAVHIGGLVIDTYMPFGAREILVPGSSTYRTVPVALGVIAMYVAALVLTSSWLKKHYPIAVWRAIHVLSIPAFVLSLLHGIFSGADAGRAWVETLYIATGTIVVFLLVLRGFVAGIRPERRAQSSPRSVPPSAGSSAEPAGDGARRSLLVGVGEGGSSAGDGVRVGERDELPS